MALKQDFMRTNNQSWKKKHFDDEKTLSIYILGFILDEYGDKPVGETVVSVNFFTVTQKEKNTLFSCLPLRASLNSYQTLRKQARAKYVLTKKFCLISFEKAIVT